MSMSKTKAHEKITVVFHLLDLPPPPCIPADDLPSLVLDTPRCNTGQNHTPNTRAAQAKKLSLRVVPSPCGRTSVRIQNESKQRSGIYIATGGQTWQRALTQLRMSPRRARCAHFLMALSSPSSCGCASVTDGSFSSM